MTEKTKRTRRGGYRGRRPPPERIAEMNELGYLLPAQVVESFDMVGSRVYRWANGGKLAAPAGDSRAAVVRDGKNNIWILRAAVEAAIAPGTPS